MLETAGQIPIDFQEEPTITDSNRKGDLAEYYAVTWLWDNGYEVFVNAGCTGPIDMVAVKNGKTILIDVKTRLHDPRFPNAKKSRGRTRTKAQKEMGVVVLAFDPDTRKLWWVDHKE